MGATTARTERPPALVALAFAAGTADAAAYLGLGHVFVANMTGNTVLLGVALASGSGAAGARSGVSLAGFCAGVALGTVVLGIARARGVAAVLAVEALALAGLLGGWLAVGTPLGVTRYVLIALAAVAMGLQSAAVASSGAEVATTYITGTLTRGIVRRQLRVPGSIWAIYVAAATAGVLAQHAWHGAVVAISLAIVLVVTAAVARRTAPAGGRPARERQERAKGAFVMAVSHSHALTNGDSATDGAFWREHTRVFLQPIAAPAILGLFGFAGATFMVAANLAGWYGTTKSGQFLFPFAAMFGGVAQFAAAMWSYRARDALATAMFGMFGSFWVAYGILNWLGANGTITLPTGKFPELGFWFFMIAAITASGAVAATARNIVLTLILAAVAVGEALLGVGEYVGGTAWIHSGAWVLIAAAILAFYGATAMLLAATWGRTVLPLGEYAKAATIPGRRPTVPLEFELGEPGVRQGQ